MEDDPDEALRRPADRYSELPNETRVFLERLRPEEITDLAEAINFMRSVRTVGRIMRWIIIAVVGTFLGAVALGDAIARVLGWFTPRQ